MNLQIRTRGIEMTRPLEEVVERRIRFALNRFGERVRHVHVQLTDLNGPRGGVDTRCKVEVSLDSIGSVIVHETSDTPFTAVALASDTVSRAVRRKIKRLQGRRRA